MSKETPNAPSASSEQKSQQEQAITPKQLAADRKTLEKLQKHYAPHAPSTSQASLLAKFTPRRQQPRAPFGPSVPEYTKFLTLVHRYLPPREVGTNPWFIRSQENVKFTFEDLLVRLPILIQAEQTKLDTKGRPSNETPLHTVEQRDKELMQELGKVLQASESLAEMQSTLRDYHTKGITHITEYIDGGQKKVYRTLTVAKNLEEQPYSNPNDLYYAHIEPQPALGLLTLSRLPEFADIKKKATAFADQIDKARSERQARALAGQSRRAKPASPAPKVDRTPQDAIDTPPKAQTSEQKVVLERADSQELQQFLEYLESIEIPPTDENEFRNFKEALIDNSKRAGLNVYVYTSTRGIHKTHTYAIQSGTVPVRKPWEEFAPSLKAEIVEKITQAQTLTPSDREAFVPQVVEEDTPRVTRNESGAISQQESITTSSDASAPDAVVSEGQALAQFESQEDQMTPENIAFIHTIEKATNFGDLNNALYSMPDSFIFRDASDNVETAESVKDKVRKISTLLTDAELQITYGQDRNKQNALKNYNEINQIVDSLPAQITNTLNIREKIRGLVRDPIEAVMTVARSVETPTQATSVSGNGDDALGEAQPESPSATDMSAQSSETRKENMQELDAQEEVPTANGEVTPATEARVEDDNTGESELNENQDTLAFVTQVRSRLNESGDFSDKNDQTAFLRYFQGKRPLLHHIRGTQFYTYSEDGESYRRYTLLEVLAIMERQNASGDTTLDFDVSELPHGDGASELSVTAPEAVRVPPSPYQEGSPWASSAPISSPDDSDKKTPDVSTSPVSGEPQNETEASSLQQEVSEAPITPSRSEVGGEDGMSVIPDAPGIERDGNRMNLETGVTAERKFQESFSINDESLQSIEGFIDLTPAQKLLVFENVKAYADQVKGPMYRGFYQGFLGVQLDNVPKAGTKGIEAYRSVISALVQDIKEKGVKVYIDAESGELETSFVNIILEGKRKHRESIHAAIREVDSAARILARTPRVIAERNSKGGSKIVAFLKNKFSSEGKKQEEYSDRVKQLKEAKAVLEQTLYTARFPTREVTQALVDIDKRVLETQMVLAHPELTSHAEQVKDRTWLQKVGAFVSDPANLTALGVGYASKALAFACMGVVGAQVASGAWAGIKGWNKEDAKQREQDRAAKTGVVDNSETALNVAAAEKTIKIGKEERKVGAIDKLELLLEEVRVEVFGNADQANAEKILERLLERLMTRVQYTEDKLRLDRMSFGKPEERAGQIARAFEAIAEARVFLSVYGLDDNTQEKEQRTIFSRWTSVDKIRDDKRNSKRREKKRIAAELGVLKGAGLFLAGNLAAGVVDDIGKSTQFQALINKATVLGREAGLLDALVDETDMDSVRESSVPTYTDSFKAGAASGSDADTSAPTPAAEPERVIPESVGVAPSPDSTPPSASAVPAPEAPSNPELHTVQKGDTVWKIMSGLEALEDDALTEQQKNTAIANVLEFLKAEAKLSEIGITSGDADKIYPGDEINVDALNKLLEKEVEGADASNVVAEPSPMQNESTKVNSAQDIQVAEALPDNQLPRNEVYEAAIRSEKNFKEYLQNDVFASDWELYRKMDTHAFIASDYGNDIGAERRPQLMNLLTLMQVAISDLGPQKSIVPQEQETLEKYLGRIYTAMNQNKQLFESKLIERADDSGDISDKKVTEAIASLVTALASKTS